MGERGFADFKYTPEEKLGRNSDGTSGAYDRGIDMSVGAGWSVTEESADALFGAMTRSSCADNSSRADLNEDVYTDIRSADENDDLTSHTPLDDSDLTVNIAEDRREFVFIGDGQAGGGATRHNTHITRVAVAPELDEGYSDDGDTVNLSGAELLGFGSSYVGADSGYTASATGNYSDPSSLSSVSGRAKRQGLDSAYSDLLYSEDTAPVTYPDPEYTSFLGYEAANYTAGRGAAYPDPEKYEEYPDLPLPEKNRSNTEPYDEENSSIPDYEEAFTGIKRDRRERERELLTLGAMTAGVPANEQARSTVEYDDPDDEFTPVPNRTRKEELSHYAALHRHIPVRVEEGERVFDKNAVAARIKAERSRDMELVVARDAFERAEMTREYERGSMRFGKMTFGEERELIHLRRELSAARRRLRHAKAAERHDNDRYYYAPLRAPEDIKLSSRGDRERLLQLTAEAGRLLSERDEINRELTALYRGGTGRGRLRSLRKIAEVERKASLKEYKRLRPIARELGRKGTSGLKRQQVYTLMDERVELVGRLAVADWRIWHEKMSRQAKRELRIQRREMRRDLQDNGILLNRHSERALIDVRRHSRANMSTVLGILGLMLIIAAIFLVWYFREPIIEFLRQVLDGTLSRLPEILPDGPSDGGDTAFYDAWR